MSAEPPRYRRLADELSALIQAGALRPGDRLPSVRQTQASRGCSAATVFQAYHLLEARGLIRAAERSGYFVAPAAAPVATPAHEPQPVAVSEMVFQLLGTGGHEIHTPLGSAFPSPTLFPFARLRSAMIAGSRRLVPEELTQQLPGGHEGLRRQIALRYLRLGMSIAPDEIVLTDGALEGLNLSLQLLTRPGDAVLIESPCFYAALQALERLGLRAIEVPTQAASGADLDAMARLIERHAPAACWLMTSFQNPLGSLMPVEKKRALVALLERHGIPLIEDDVYAELQHHGLPPLPAKAYATQGGVLHAGSFAKTLAPGWRVGWVAAGRFAPALQRAKLSQSLSGSWPAQAAIAHYLEGGDYERHLRALRRALAAQQRTLRAAVLRHFPAGTRVTQPEGGYFLWVELPAAHDSLSLQRAALQEGISLAPGPLFCAQGRFLNCLRLNAGQPWTPTLAAAVARLGELIRSQTAASAPYPPAPMQAR
ncbi:PLP-dependent aminotransferase family protein [Roseateles sp. DC23W]|uniref:PLP-dependent aminotransferase family protein n=1 Tax=Pelomonas dachongensis TaxID=3299029 RepID=A0ABW7EQ89_9BURK